MSAHAALAPRRKRLEKERLGSTVKLEVSAPEGTYDLYVTANVYPDGRVGEVFIRGAGKEGSTMHGMIQAFATMLSIALQHGADLGLICRKIHRGKYDPCGSVNHPEIGHADSLPDAVVKWLALRFGDDALRADMELPS